jgi:hypothetical protein
MGYPLFTHHDRDGLERRMKPRLDAEPSVFVELHQKRRFMCHCVECGGSMPHHTPDMICTKCQRQIAGELEAMGFGNWLKGGAHGRD